jgi:hypothetical protein
MQDVILKLVDVPMVRMFVLAGILFLLIAVLGKIEAGNIGRIGSAILGVVLIVIGLAMQYGDTHDVYARLTPNASVAPPTQTAASTPLVASAVANTETALIRVLSGTYGGNCNGKAGNATALLSKPCDGRGSCDFTIDTAALEDPAPNCSKDFSAEWQCGNGNVVFSAALPSLSGKNDVLHLNCVK